MVLRGRCKDVRGGGNGYAKRNTAVCLARGVVRCPKRSGGLLRQRTLPPDVVFAKVNAEEEPDLAMAHGIRAIPTPMAFRDGVQVFEQAGDQIETLIWKPWEGFHAFRVGSAPVGRATRPGKGVGEGGQQPFLVGLCRLR